MDESEDNISAEDTGTENNFSVFKMKPKKRSLVERELETTLTARVTSPVIHGEDISTSRYGRARRVKTNSDFCDTEKAVTKVLKSPVYEKIPVKSSPPAYKMHASNSPVHNESHTRVSVDLENQIENIYNTNISLSRFGSEEKTSPSSVSGNSLLKVYIRKDLIQTKEKEENVTLIKNIFSPVKSTHKPTNSHLSNILERSSEKYNLNGNIPKPQNGYLDTSSVVKTLDFDGKKKKKKDNRETKTVLSKNELFELEATCTYQVGDLVWARMGTYPFWPCIVTREPVSEMFVKKKLFGRIERDMIHVTFFGDNGRRSWILDTMLRKFLGLAEFKKAREQFTPEAKKKDPKLYNAFFISEKKLAPWLTSIEEAEMLQREPKRLRIDIFNDMLGKSRIKYNPKSSHKSGKITRTDSDVSLSESLYDSLFSEEDGKNEDPDRSRNKSRNKSLDVSEVVTACLDNMAAKTGMTKIQRQSHMDIWLQKAKSKTPEKSQLSISVTVEKVDKDGNAKVKARDKESSKSKKRKTFPKEDITKKPYSLRRSAAESQNLLSHHNEHDYSKVTVIPEIEASNHDENYGYTDTPNIICVIDKVESLCNLETESNPKSSKVPNETYEEFTDTDISQDQIVSGNDTTAEDSESIISRTSNRCSTNYVDDFSIPENDTNITDESTNKDVHISSTSNNDVNQETASDKNKLAEELVYSVSLDKDIDTDNQNPELLDTNESVSEQSEEQSLPINEEIGNIDNKEQDIVEPTVDNMSVDEYSTESENSQNLFESNEDEYKLQPFVEFIKQNENLNYINETVFIGSEKVQNEQSNTIKPTNECDTINVDSVTTKISENNENIDQPNSELIVEKAIGNVKEDLLKDQETTYMEKALEESVPELLDTEERKTIQKQKVVKANKTESLVNYSLGDMKTNSTESKECPEIINETSRDELNDEYDIGKMLPNKLVMEQDSEPMTNSGDIEIERNAKVIDPEIVSISSISSEVSNSSELLPKITGVASLSVEENINSDLTDEDLQKIKDELLFDSDNESASSQDEITLSELKRRSESKDKPEMHLNKNEDTMDSIKSETSTNRKLRLVLTDCILQSKGSKLPEIRDITSKTHAEIEIAGKSSPEADKKLKKRKLHLRKSKSSPEPVINGVHESKEASPEHKPKEELEIDTISIHSSDSGASIKRKGKKPAYENMKEPEFLQYVELREDALIDEHPELSRDEIIAYLYKTWQYEENLKSDIKKTDDIEQSNLVKGVNREPIIKKKVNKQKKLIDIAKVMSKETKSFIQLQGNAKPRDLPKRKTVKPFYREDYSDIEDEIEMFEIFKAKKRNSVPKTETATEDGKITNIDNLKSEESDNKVTIEVTKVENKIESNEIIEIKDDEENEEYYDEEEIYFESLTKPKPNIFRGLVREKVCEICEKTSNLVKCKGCNGMFHVDCVKKVVEVVEVAPPTRGRKKKKKPRGRKPKTSTDSNGEESHSDEKSHDANVSEENMSIEEIKDPDPIVIADVDNFEAQLAAKMQEMIQNADKIDYDSYSSDDGLDWSDTVAGKCKIVDIKLKPKTQPMTVDYSDFKCKNCQEHDTPICFVCKSAVSPKGKIETRQKCQVPHCHKYYHVECLDHWPQTQFTSREPSRNKKADEPIEALACPRHVCHTCVCDDPRGCKTRFSGDKLARCVRCPATYHSFTKCLPAGSQILSASHIVCPRHYEHRPGKVPCHVNTGWCFICALGGTLICCEYCPTSFHADCLNIEPPEGGYMCEDCETGRLPLYGEMVWVKLGHYRWWPGIVLHPSEIPDNIMAVKHSPGEFVVRFFGQYDHYWVNRGRVFPFQEGDSGRISGQKSKINEAFTKAMEHAQRAFEILKNIEPNDEENQDIASSLLPPHYVKLKVNKPCGSLYGRKVDIEESSLTQCECNPDEEDPCGPYSHCLNRMLLTECGPTCRAGERCQNRAFEKRLYPKMIPYRTPHRGWGLKTLEDIKAGQFVIEYVGELIDEEEFRRRMRRKHEIRDENFYFLTLDKERMIDAGPKGNLARFMNHCCEPNCETQKWTVLGDVRVGLFAIHDIPANTEVTFNYNLQCAGIEKKQCMCGAKRCSGYIGAKPKQDEPQAKKSKLVKRNYKKRKLTSDSPSTSKTKPKRPVGRPAKPRELTDIEKDLLIIKNATDGLSSDSESSDRLSSVESERRDTKALKRKRVSFSTEEVIIYNGASSPSVKRMKLDDEKVSGDD